MADFPALEPKTRSYDFGDYAMSEKQSLGGGNTRFNHAADPNDHGMALGYEEITRMELELFRVHYRLQRAGHRSFNLPAIIWQGHPDEFLVVPIEARWKYAGVLEETHIQGVFYNLIVPLQYVGATTTA